MSPEPDVGVRSIRLLSTSQYNPWDEAERNRDHRDGEAWKGRSWNHATARTISAVSTRPTISANAVIGDGFPIRYP